MRCSSKKPLKILASPAKIMMSDRMKINVSVASPKFKITMTEKIMNNNPAIMLKILNQTGILSEIVIFFTY